MNQPTLLDLKSYKSLLAPRVRKAHKGLFGHVLVVGGNYGMPGAVRLAAEAALRCGAGLVSVATRSKHVGVIACGRPEIMVHGIENAQDLELLVAQSTVIVVGPGLGQTTWSKDLFYSVLAAPQVKVIDADALNLLAQNPSHSSNWVLTPHLGEAARLLRSEIALLQMNRIQAVWQLQKKYNGVVILKGADSLVCTANTLKQCQAGNPGMASGGMGDVLSGVIGALLAQGLNLQQAAELGVCLHAKAGDLAAQALGERGLLAMDLMPFLHQLVNP
jgi:hydroxyethylthiazole kinase-like uncharacterized protein yjeF